MALTRGDVRLPPLPQKTVNCPELGGEVIVQGLLLRDRLAMASEPGQMRQLADVVPQMLAATVIQPDGKPLLTIAEWNQFGATHSIAALGLFEVASELSGLRAEAAEKN